MPVSAAKIQIHIRHSQIGFQQRIDRQSQKLFTGRCKAGAADVAQKKPRFPTKLHQNPNGKNPEKYSEKAVALRNTSAVTNQMENSVVHNHIHNSHGKPYGNCHIFFPGQQKQEKQTQERKVQSDIERSKLPPGDDFGHKILLLRKKSLSLQAPRGTCNDRFFMKRFGNYTSRSSFAITDAHRGHSPSALAFSECIQHRGHFTPFASLTPMVTWG